MQLTFVGSGDAFGSGGRFHTCFHLRARKTNLLLDCGASSLIALKRIGIDRNSIDSILITHFHGDHFGGIPYFILDAQFSKRTRPLRIIGPVGLRDWYVRVLETTFPGSSGISQKFEIDLVELDPGVPARFDHFELTAALVMHGRSGGAFHAYRLGIEGRTIAYTGDTEWTEALTEIGKNADLLIAEAYFVEKKVPLHLDLKTLAAKLPSIDPKRLVLTHMSDDVLERQHEFPFEFAADGKTIHL